MDILVKISGDLENDERFYNWLDSNIDSSSNRLFILCGGRSVITETLKEHGVTSKFGPGGREIESLEGRRLAQQALQKRKTLVENKLWKKGIDATVFIPVVEVGDRIFHMDGDVYATALYPNFNKTFIVTLKGRDKSFPANLKKIKIVHL